MRQALGLCEPHGWAASMVILDGMEKNAAIEVLQVELNDLYGACIRIFGGVADVEHAIAFAGTIAGAMHVECSLDVIASPSDRSQSAYLAKNDFNLLIEEDVVHRPDPQHKELSMNEQSPFAIGLIETQGLTAVIEAIDTACKTANVEVIAREKLGGGYITVVIKGDVAAVQAAVEAGKRRVGDLGKLIAAHVIPQPSAGVLSLLPKV